MCVLSLSFSSCRKNRNSQPVPAWINISCRPQRACVIKVTPTFSISTIPQRREKRPARGARRPFLATWTSGGTEHPYVDDDDWDSTDPHIAMMIADHIGDLKARRADELGEHPFALCLRAVNSSIPTTPPPHHDTEYTKSGSITLTDRVWIDQGGDWDDSMPSWTAEFGPWRRDYLTDSDSDS